MLDSLDHHAYAFVGSREAVLPKLSKAIEKSGTHIQGNPDVRIEAFETFGIAEAWRLKESAERTAVTGGKKIFIVATNGITKEAQNALLKILEEPPKETHFFFIVPTLETLLPTLRSRIETLRASDARSEHQMLGDAKAFLSGSVPARLKTVQGMLKELEDEKKEREEIAELLPAKERILDFLDALEHALADDTKKNRGALSELLEVKKYSRDRAPSFKLLLEHLALVLPKH